MHHWNRLVLIGAALGLLNLVGCVVAGPYTYDHGDRIDRYGHHEAHWCDAHSYDEHCH